MTSQTTNVDQFQNLPSGDTSVRVRTDNGAPWFVLADVCGVLGIRNSRDAAASLDDDEKDGVGIPDIIGRIQENTIINESGLYSLILRSRKPAAKKFKKWVTSEVLPTIRRTGAYDTTQQTQAEPAPISKDERSFQSTGIAPVGLLCDAIRARMIRCGEAGTNLDVRSSDRIEGAAFHSAFAGGGSDPGCFPATRCCRSTIACMRCSQRSRI